MNTFEKIEMRDIISKLGMAQADVARAIGISHGHLRNVLSGTQPLSKRSMKDLRELLKDATS